MKALIVEDEIALQQLYSRILKSVAGYDVTCTGDGDAAIHFLENNHLPDLIILDIRMPLCNGHAVLEYLQRRNDVDQVHVIIASASRQYEAYLEMLPSAEFLLKPILPTRLQEVVNRLRDVECP